VAKSRGSVGGCASTGEERARSSGRPILIAIGRSTTLPPLLPFPGVTRHCRPDGLT
jgi:hypothetical protein